MFYLLHNSPYLYLFSNCIKREGNQISFISLEIVLSKMKNFQIALVVVVATLATSLAVPLSEPVPVNSTLMKSMGTINVDGVGPIHIVSRSTGNVRVNVDCHFQVYAN